MPTKFCIYSAAPDLYEGSSDDFVDDALIAYVEETYPDEIMNSTYNDDGTSSFDSVHKAISPLTAYCLGLTDTCPELEQFPKLANITPGVFRYPADSGSTPDTGNDADGGGEVGMNPTAPRHGPAPWRCKQRKGAHTLPNEDFPLRVDGVTAGWAAERRPEDVIPAARTDAWQLVYVRSGTIEERCDDRRVLLRAGGLCSTSPAEAFAMTPGGRGPAR